MPIEFSWFVSRMGPAILALVLVLAAGTADASERPRCEPADDRPSVPLVEVCPDEGWSCWPTSPSMPTAPSLVLWSGDSHAVIGAIRLPGPDSRAVFDMNRSAGGACPGFARRIDRPPR
jgi:hypothetical protein